MYAAFVVGHHLVHIGQSETKAFDVVEAAGGYAVELLEDVLQVVLADADAVVGVFKIKYKMKIIVIIFMDLSSK